MDSSVPHTIEAPHAQHDPLAKDGGHKALWWVACLCLGGAGITVWMMNGNALFMEMVSAAWALCF